MRRCRWKRGFAGTGAEGDNGGEGLSGREWPIVGTDLSNTIACVKMLTLSGNNDAYDQACPITSTRRGARCRLRGGSAVVVRPLPRRWRLRRIQLTRTRTAMRHVGCPRPARATAHSLRQDRRSTVSMDIDQGAEGGRSWHRARSRRPAPRPRLRRFVPCRRSGHRI